MIYDFIEIGTSDMQTLLETGAGKRGLSIEPVHECLDRLPDVEGITKICAAISNRDGWGEVFWVSLKDIEKYGLSGYLRGCNSLNSPHPTTMKELERFNLVRLLQKTPCRLISWPTLVKEYEVEAVDYLKIDAEGHDWVIVDHIIDTGLFPRPNLISFECNWILSPGGEFMKTHDRLIQEKYEFIPRPDGGVDDGDRFFRNIGD